MIEFNTFYAIPVNGKIKIDLSSDWKSVALMDIVFFDGTPYEINVTCDQVDKTILNPNRLLRRFWSSKYVRVNSFGCLIWRRIDSSDRFLTIRLTSADGEVINVDEKISFTIGLSDELL